MEHKFISQDPKTKIWKISNTKYGKSIKNFKTKEETIKNINNLKNITSYEIKVNDKWTMTIVKKDVLKNISSKPIINKNITKNSQFPKVEAKEQEKVSSKIITQELMPKINNKKNFSFLLPIISFAILNLLILFIILWYKSVI